MLKDDDRMILSKSVAFAISSPIDTYRQNKLIHKNPTLKKSCFGMGAGFIASSLVAIPCHKTISFLERYQMNEIVSVSIGVIVANIFKIPILYNYKRIQTGLKLTKKVPMNTLKEVMKLCLVEDILEETVKYSLSKKNMTTESSLTRNALESVLLFSISYPFDIIKNRGMYGLAHIKGGKKDFASKAIHKNLQNVLFFNMLKLKIV
tara:strand:- start:8438 stop:9055 length:618 start_codon:yes stop_codon:yes gene_type:complete